MEKEYLYARKKEILKMFEDINVEKRKETNLSRSSEVSNDSIKKVLTKSRIKDMTKHRK